MTTQSRLKELLNYNPDSGEFTNLKPRQGAKPGGRVGCTSPTGYLLISIDKVLYKAHRLAWLYVYGDLPTKQIDHINGDKSDNRMCNLREADAAENQQNLRSAKKNNRTGLLGVSYDRRKDRYRATIYVNRKQKHIGSFKTAEEASAAYQEAKAQLHPFARLA